ncbi:MAG: serine hydrolase [Henriciella sp.]|nr:serine hydrolase [Henriciella sp.]
MFKIIFSMICLVLFAWCATAPSDIQASPETSNLVAARLPVSVARDGFSIEQSRDFHRRATVAELLTGRDVSLWWNGHVSNAMRSAIIPRRSPTRPLSHAPRPEIGAIRAQTTLGNMSLETFLDHPESYARGFIVIHRGQIVFERYPGMQQSDLHLWASNAKPTVSLLIDLLIAEGKIDESQPYKTYMSDFEGTALGEVKVKDILDMATGLNIEENNETRSDPSSIAIRVFLSEFGEADPIQNKWISVREILKDGIAITEPGSYFGYGSPITQALVLLAEEVTGHPFQDEFDNRVWSEMGVDGSLYMAVAPDGMPAAHGIVSSTLLFPVSDYETDVLNC